MITSLVLVLSVSIFIRVVALILTIVLLRRMRDWRMGFLALMLGLMGLQQALTLYQTLSAGGAGVPATTEMPGLAVSILALLTVLFLERLLVQQQREPQALRESEEIYRDLYEEAPHAYFSIGADGRIQMLNRRSVELLGYARDDLVGRPVLDLYADTPAGRDNAQKVLARFRAGEDIRGEKLEMRRADGNSMWVSLTVQPIKDAQGQIVQSRSMVVDITEQVQAEEALRESEGKYRQLVDLAQEGIWLIDKDSCTTFVNPSMAEMLGYSSDEMIGRHLFSFMDERGVEIATYNLERRQAGISEQHDFEFLRKDGSRIYTTMETAPITDKDGHYAGAIAGVIDVTERAQAEEALRDSRNLLQTVLDSIPSAVFWKDRDSIYLGGNRAWLEAAGLKSAEEGVGKSDYDLPWEKEQADSFREGDRRVMESGIPEYDFITPHFRADGTRAWAKANKVPLRDTEGHVAGVLGTYEDITERKRVEEELRGYRTHLEELVEARTAELNERVTEVEGLNRATTNLLNDLQAANRKLAETGQELQRANAELETFTYSVSHDLKAPLRGIDGYSRLLLQDHAEQLDEEGRTFLHTIRRAAEQMNQLIEDLLAYSRLERRALVRGQVNPRELVETLVAEQAEEIRECGASLTVELPCQAVIGEAEGLAQALRNLLGNALKFTRDVPEPRIEIGGRETENSCIIWVRDNGIGFDMQYHDRIFEIFQRLHRAEEYPGTGVGLAVVRKAVERMGGRVWAEGALGEGATFYLEIPQ